MNRWFPKTELTVLAVLTCIAFAVIALTAKDESHAQTPNRGCNQTAIFDSSTSGNVQLVALKAGNSIRICGFGFFAGGTSSGKLIYGTGSTCGTGAADITPAFPFTINTSLVYAADYFQGFAAPPGNALCVTLGASAKLTGFVTYSQSP